jgi:lipid-A-disaccharide synthase
VRLAITSNGPGEFSGWVRPLLHALYAREPGADVTLFFVPDDYATGREPEVARSMFPQARVVTPRDYVRFALGRRGPSTPDGADIVLYLGGDLMHAARVQRRLGGRARAYKFSRARYRALFERIYAVDAANERQLEGWGIPRERIETVGNLAVDGALEEAAGTYSRGQAETSPVEGGVLIMPGARRREIANLVPFFLQAALWLRRFAPGVPVAFGVSPFTTDAELADALARGGDPRFWGARGRVVDGAIVGGADERFPIVRDAMRHAARARAALAIPGTKCIELAALGVPSIVCSPLNAPELIVLNGPLTYLDRVPLAGAPLKRALVERISRRFPMLAQPNIDAGEALMPELRGALMPGRVARVAAEYLGDDAALARASQRLRALYAAHAGAAGRMARSLLAGVPGQAS